MASPSETGATEGVAVFPHSFGLRLLLALAAVFLLHFTHLTASGGLWAPSVGLCLVLVAWFGPWAGLLLIGAGLLAVLQTVLLNAFFAGRIDPAPVSITAGVALLEAAEVLTAWWIYRRLGGGARALNDPQSAVLFVLAVPGLTALLFATVCTLYCGAVLGEWGDFSGQLIQWWLSQALGFLAVAPPLLTAATPWLVRRGIVRPETSSWKHSTDGADAGADPLTRGDAIEIAGLAFGAGLLTLLLVWTYGRQELEGWQPWGAPLLLIVWASLRQGQRGGVLVGGVAAALPLCLAALNPVALPQHYAFLIQGNLMALGGAGLLAAAAAGWVRVNERRYRQMVAHVPVVVYSGRLLTGGGRLEAEVTLVARRQQRPC